jgi:cytochrome c oxidase subunit III
MSENVLTFPRGLPRQQVAPNAVIGTLIFVVAELMLFAGFMSAFTITRAAYNTWPPVGQPRLPVAATAFNTALLLASGVVLFFANRAFKREPRSATRLTLAALLLGSAFVCLQGFEWVQLLREGLTIASSNHGAFFYVIIGTHALHAIGAVIALGIMYAQMRRGSLTHGAFLGGQVFWYFVVGTWPVLYLRVYL